jgi:hypothetical protein
MIKFRGTKLIKGLQIKVPIIFVLQVATTTTIDLKRRSAQISTSHHHVQFSRSHDQFKKEEEKETKPRSEERLRSRKIKVKKPESTIWTQSLYFSHPTNFNIKKEWESNKHHISHA